MMGIRSRRRRDYVKAERKFLSLHRRYLQTHQPADLRRIVSLWRALQLDAHRTSMSKTVISGWVSLRSGSRLSRVLLKKLNPDYSIRVRWRIRADAPHHPLRDGLMTGFTVTAIATSTAPRFLLTLQRRDGRMITMRPSNSEARYRLTKLGLNDLGLERDESGFAFIDSVTEVPAGASMLDELIAKNSSIAVQVVAESEARAFAPTVARVLRRVALADRDADRAELIAAGRNGRFSSDLQLVDVTRCYDVNESRETVPVPVPRRVGSRVEFVDGKSHTKPVSARWHTIADASVQAGGVVVAGGSLHVYEWAADPNWDFVSGQWAEVFGGGSHRECALVVTREAAETSLDEAILLSGRNDSNWYHWMVEYLPRVVDIPDEVGSDVPLLITERVPSEGVAALGALTQRPILVIPSDRAQTVRQLHVRAPVAQVLDTTRVPWSHGVAIDPVPIRAAARALSTAAGVVSTPAERRVFLSRTSRHRGLQNEQELAEIAAAKGLEVVDPSALSWVEQVQLFMNARLVVGAGGAVMANYVHMPRGSTAIALTSEALVEFVLPAILAQLGGAAFMSIVGPTATTLQKSRSRVEWMHSNYSVGAVDFSRELDRVLQRL